MARRESVDIVLKPEVAKFYRDYTADFSKLTDLYFGDPGSLQKYVEMADDPYLRMIKRPKLHQTLLEYNQSLGAPVPVMENIARLRYDGAYCVLAWQQPYILGGPLETFLKVLTALKICEKLNQAGTNTFVPVLWNHADDHELTEVNRVNLPVASRLVEERLEVDETERPSEAVETGDAYDALLGRLRKHLAETPHKEWLLEKLVAAKGQDLADHFSRLMIQLFGDQGLVLACPRIFRSEIAALMGRAIENPEKVDRLLKQQKQALEEKGYECHTKWDDPLWLYRLSEGHPYRLKYEGEKFVYAAPVGGEMTPAQVAAEVKKWPQIYTNGVLLSPLEQDSCVPSVAHIAGPGGCEFFGVQKALFDDFRVAFPQILPQISATLVDKRTAKGLADLGKKPEQLISEARAAAGAEDALPVDPRIALAKLREGVTKAMEDYTARTGEIEAEASKIAGEIGPLVARELDRLAKASQVGPTRAAVLAALAKYEERAKAVSDDVAGALAEVRKRIEGELPERHEAAALAPARAQLEKAAAALAAAAKPEGNPASKRIAPEVARSLDEITRTAADAASRDADKKVSDADVAKLLVAPEGGLQEDTIGMIHFFNVRGPALSKEVLGAIDPFDFKHQVVFLD